ncbi:MAG: caspase family protein, partial [Spirochaetia bacterium]|nr:caspase family protein [Spirochaetia bacterium]
MIMIGRVYMKRCLLVVLLVTVLITGLFAFKVDRYALVVGNGAYEKTTKLANPVNDAGDVADMLSDLGFKVRLETNTTLSRMEGAVREFSKEARDAKASTTLFFYAGHGVQYEGINYLLPVDADIQRDYELRSKALSMDMVSSALEDTKSGFNLVMLDACRDNPFASGRGGSRGLGVMGGGTAESMVVFATAPGSVAQDGDGRNSPFTAALKQHLATP